MKQGLCVFFFVWWSFSCLAAADKSLIRISTDETDLILQVAPNGRLYQSYLGPRLLNETDLEHFSAFVHAGTDGSVSDRGWEVYPGSGMEDYFEPVLGITHSDGNMTTLLKYVDAEQQRLEENVEETVITLRDEVYPVEVKLHYVSFARENIIKIWSEVKHQEKKPVRLFRYASAMLYFEQPRYFLTEFSGDWAREAVMTSQPLQFGKKIIDTKLGSRAAMHAHPFFQLGLGQPVAEDQGEVIVGTIGWTGNFRFTFEVDNVGNLRVISGINPYASYYELEPGQVFRTPEFIFTRSDAGAGKASRSFHDWARRYQVKDGLGERLTLLNNWENTGFNFNEEKLLTLMEEAAHLGVDLFLLDDGWFGNKHPRNDDRAG